MYSTLTGLSDLVGISNKIGSVIGRFGTYSLYGITSILTLYLIHKLLVKYTLYTMNNLSINSIPDTRLGDTVHTRITIIPEYNQDRILIHVAVCKLSDSKQPFQPVSTQVLEQRNCTGNQPIILTKSIDTSDSKLDLSRNDTVLVQVSTKLEQNTMMDSAVFKIL